MTTVTDGPDVQTPEAAAGETDAPGELAQWAECPACRRTRRRAEARPVQTFRRADRSFAEILQEVRVAQTGMQLLVAFLLAAPFSQRFPVHTAADRVLYVVSLVSGTFSAGLLIGPVPFHRLVYGRRMKRELVTAANRLVRCGMALMVVSVTSSLSLVLGTVAGDRTAMVATFGSAAWFLMWWYAVPLLTRARVRRRR